MSIFFIVTKVIKNINKTHLIRLKFFTAKLTYFFYFNLAHISDIWGSVHYLGEIKGEIFTDDVLGGINDTFV